MTQEPDQSYGPFQLRLRSNLEIIVDERIHAEKLTAFTPWIVELFAFGGEDPDCRVSFPGRVLPCAEPQCLSKRGVVPLTRACLQHPKVRCSIGDGNNNQQELPFLIQELNIIACTSLTHAGYNGCVMQLHLKPAACTKVVTVAHLQEQIELLSQAKSHGNIYAATGVAHLNCSNSFKYGSRQQQINSNQKCRRIDGNFDCRADAVVQLRAHRPLEGIQGFT